MEPVADEPTVSQRLLDLFVFAPAGLMVTAIEEFPRLVERGRERVTGRVTSARTVGSFAVTTGRSQLIKRAEELRKNRSGEADGPTAEPGNGSSVPPPDEPVVRAASTPSRSASPDPATPGGGSVPDTTSLPLAIPGFDTLSASQVVQRLDGLTADELMAVRVHESGHRGRRTILNRVEQLLDERS
ncbi:MAG TPA: hypothetical protein VHU17_05970 [Acidimicrobiales bacterium]|jgi:hypothetical protein|nr:hypothetical protein [Acidimicrobiales bacterium]